MTLWITLKKVEDIAGWNFSEISFLYSLNLFTYSIGGMLIWYSAYHLDDKVLSGEIDRFLLRPMGMIKQLICNQFGSTFIGQILVSLIFMIYSIKDINIQFSMFKIIFFLLCIISGIMIHMSAMIIIGSLSFRVLKSKKVGSIAYYEIREFIHYPLDIYPSYMKWILTFVLPWGFINYYPCLILLSKSVSHFEYLLGLFSPFVGLLLLIFSRKFLYRGINSYSGVGS